MITALTIYRDAPDMFWGAALTWQNTDGCLHTQISTILEPQRWHATKIPPVFARLESSHSRSNTAAGTMDLVGVSFMVPLHCASRRWTMHENQSSRCLHPLGLGHWVEKVVAILQAGDKEVLVSPSSYHQFWIKNVVLYQARHSGSNIDRAMKVRTLTECKARGQWRMDQSFQRCEKSARLAADYLVLPCRTRDVIETFVPLAERAILGTSQGSAFTGV